VADQVAAALAPQRFPGNRLAAPASIRNKDGRGLRVFAPFRRRVQSPGDPPPPLPEPKGLRPAPDPAGDTLENWSLEPTVQAYATVRGS
jgi:deoxyribodipyrimidine photo-lyase